MFVLHMIDIAYAIKKMQFLCLFNNHESDWMLSFVYLVKMI